jgi:LacI family transcriptional regulator
MRARINGKAGGRPGGMSRGGASIQDVAREAKVSIATVSRVVNQPTLVTEETASRVREAIKKLGYVPNAYAQGLSGRGGKVLGIVLPDIFGEFYSELLRGADGEARRLGYHLLVSSDAHDHGHPTRNENLAFGLIDGLALMMTEPNVELWRETLDAALPTVVLDAEVNEPGVDSVSVDNTEGTREATEHLLSTTPPDRCFFVGGPKENFDTKARAEVFCATLATAGRPCTEPQVSCGEYSVDWGRAWGRERQRGAGLKGCAVLAANDEIALGVMQAAQEAGVRVPEDLKIVGFDDTRLATLVRPSLSTVRVPLQEVGAAAVRLLVERVTDSEKPATRMKVGTKLVVRESSRA